MRHVYIRGILALTWLAAAIFSGVSGNLGWAGLYVLTGAAFGCSACTAGKTTFLKTLSGLHESFRCDSIRLHGRPVSFRDKDFKLCRYTVFALKRPLLLLDEPVNGLDFQSTEYQLIAGYKEFGTVLFSSHILESVTLTSDRVLILEDGHIRRSFEGSQINVDTIREALHDENEF